jgi:uncharacterized membrane protein
MRRWLPGVLIAGAVLFSLAVYSKLPDRVPVHWGPSGEPNRYCSRIEGAFLMPAIMIAVWVLMTWFPSRDPRAANIAKFRGSYDLVVAVALAFMAGVHVLALGNALGWGVDVTTVVLVGVGLLFIVIGNLLPRARSNFIFGIRTPWTLSSETVWARSNRIGGYSMVAAGLLMVAAAFLDRPARIIVALGSAMAAGLVPIVYSYIAWSRERGQSS